VHIHDRVPQLIGYFFLDHVVPGLIGVVDVISRLPSSFLTVALTKRTAKSLPLGLLQRL
jgi:hypothetical protein